MRLLILGAYGMLGHKLIQVLGERHDVFATCRTPNEKWNEFLGVTRDHIVPGVTVENTDSLVGGLAETRPDVVVNCIGVIKQLDTAKLPITSIAVNSLFPHRLASLCAATGSRLIHFSTDCVFSGSTGGYTEESPSDALDLYGRSKYLGEVGEPHCVTIRSSIIGLELASRVGLVEWFAGNARGRVKGYRNAIYSGLTTLEMARVVALIIEDPTLNGVWQVASTPISKFELLGLVNEALGLDVEIEPDDNFQCNRSLDGSRFAERTGYRAPSWPEMIREMASDPRGFIKS